MSQALVCGAAATGLWLILALVHQLALGARRRRLRRGLSALDLLGEGDDIPGLLRAANQALARVLAPRRLYNFLRQANTDDWQVEVIEDGRLVQLDPVAAAPALAALAAQAGQVVWREARATADPVQRFLHERGLDVATAARWPGGEFVAGLRSRSGPDRVDAVLLAHWAQILGARATLLNRPELSVPAVDGELASARLLEEAALAPSVQGTASWADWALRLHGHDGASWFWNTYPLGPGSLLLVLGQPAASGIAGSLLQVAVRGFCDELVGLLAERVTPERMLDDLNRFLWRPTQPIGMACQVVRVDRDRTELTVASAGESHWWWAPSGVSARHDQRCGGALLGARNTGAYRATRTAMAGPGHLVLYSAGISAGPGGDGGPGRAEQDLLDTHLGGGTAGETPSAEALRDRLAARLPGNAALMVLRVG
jgi:hypothetical protein